jgi:hypothetical protein
MTAEKLDWANHVIPVFVSRIDYAEGIWWSGLGGVCELPYGTANSMMRKYKTHQLVNAYDM